MAIGSSITREDGSLRNRRIDSRKVSGRTELSPRAGAGVSRRKLIIALLAGSLISVVAVALIPVGTTTARPWFEGGACDGCHSGAQTSSMLTVSGLPVGSYTPGLQYTIVITVVDTNGATGQNNFDLIASAGVFSTTDPNAEVNAPATGAEASANDLVTPMVATSWTVVWTAPSSGSVQMDLWAVMGDGAIGTVDIWDHKTFTYLDISEFSLVLLPIIGVVSMIILVSRIRKR